MPQPNLMMDDQNFLGNPEDMPSAEQLAIMQQLAMQAAPVAPSSLPPPPTPNPMSQNPVTPQMKNGADYASLANKLKEWSNQKNIEADKLKQYMQDYAKLDQGTDYRPIAAFVSGLTGNKELYQAAEATAPETNAQKAQKLIGFQEKVAQLADQHKNAQAYLKLLYDQQYGQRTSVLKQNVDLREGKEARSTIDKDPLLKQYVPRLEGAAKIGELINSARSGKVVSNQALLGQLNAEIARLETGSQSPGLHASEKTELLDRKAQLQSLTDAITGNPQDSVRPEVINAADKLVQELKDSYQKGIDSRFDMLKEGMTDNQKQIAQDKHDSIQKTYAPRFDGSWSGNQITAPIKQWNGKRYQLQGDHWVEIGEHK